MFLLFISTDVIINIVGKTSNNNTSLLLINHFPATLNNLKMQENVSRDKKCSGGGPPDPPPLLPRLNYASGYGPEFKNLNT